MMYCVTRPCTAACCLPLSLPVRGVRSRAGHPRREAHRNGGRRRTVPSFPEQPWRFRARRCCAATRSGDDVRQRDVPVPEPARRTLHGDRRRSRGSRRRAGKHRVSAGATITINLVLPVGEMKETVTVGGRPDGRHQGVDGRHQLRQRDAREAPDEPGCLLRSRADRARHVRGIGRAQPDDGVPESRPPTAARPTRTSS